MLSVTLRAAEAYSRAAPPLPKPVAASQRRHGALGTIVGLATIFATVALVILSRISIYAATHGYQPMFEPLRRLFG